MDILGNLNWIGSTMLSVCALPQVIYCLQYKHATGMSWGFILLWLGGEVSLLIYMIPKQEWALIANYIANIVFLAIIIYYKINPRIGDCK